MIGDIRDKICRALDDVREIHALASRGQLVPLQLVARILEDALWSVSVLLDSARSSFSSYESDARGEVPRSQLSLDLEPSAPESQRDEPELPPTPH